MQYFAQIQGGTGPDVWDKERFIDAADFADAARTATSVAAALGGQVTLLEQCDYSEDALLDAAVRRFLAWPLPIDFDPDGGVTFIHGHCVHGDHLWPTGTNLLNAPQARDMIRRVMGLV
jgi:hypothetical protein